MKRRDPANPPRRPDLADVPYREIHDRTGVSVTTIGRVARCLDLGEGGYRLAAERLGHRAHDASH